LYGSSSYRGGNLGLDDLFQYSLVTSPASLIRIAFSDMLDGYG